MSQRTDPHYQRSIRILVHLSLCLLCDVLSKDSLIENLSRNNSSRANFIRAGAEFPCIFSWKIISRSYEQHIARRFQHRRMLCFSEPSIIPRLSGLLCVVGSLETKQIGKISSNSVFRANEHYFERVEYLQQRSLK